MIKIKSNFQIFGQLEGMAHYAGQLLAPAEAFGQGVFALWAKKPFLVLSSYPSNFK